MSEGLEISLTFLSYTCVILFTLLSVFVIMLIVDLLQLSKSLRNLSDTIQKEIYPTLDEIKKALEGINGLANGVDKHLTTVKDSFATAYDTAYNLAGKFKGLAASVLGGALATLKLFLKK